MVAPLPRFIDIEASGQGVDSWPVQVACSDPDGNVESWLIDPSPVTDWDSWDVEAQAVHGFSRRALVAHGHPPSQVAMQLNARLAGTVVYSDFVPGDRFWLGRLFRAAGISCTFRIGDFWSHLQRNLSTPIAPPVLDQLAAQAERQIQRPRHRADNDVRFLIALWRRAMLMEGR